MIYRVSGMRGFLQGSYSMAKVGDGGGVPKPSEAQYREALQGNIAKFQNALASYPAAKNSEEQGRLKDIMNQQLDLIQANVREIKRSGVQKQGAVVSSDYQQFQTNPSDANRVKLEQDVSTLKEYGQLPD